MDHTRLEPRMRKTKTVSVIKVALIVSEGQARADGRTPQVIGWNDPDHKSPCNLPTVIEKGHRCREKHSMIARKYLLSVPVRLGYFWRSKLPKRESKQSSSRVSQPL